MTTEGIVEITNKDLEKIKDFWANHNFGTRIMLMIFALSFLSIVIASFFNVVVPVVVVNMVFYSAIIGFMTVTLGVNGLDTVLQGVARIKLGKYEIEKSGKIVEKGEKNDMVV